MRVPPVLDATGRPFDQVRLQGVRARGFHGVFAEERRRGQDFVVDVTCHLDTRAAAAGDDLRATVDYGALAVAVADAVRGPALDLIEALALRVARVCLGHERVRAVDVTVHKPQAPVTEPFEDVSVSIRRHREEVVAG